MFTFSRKKAQLNIINLFHNIRVDIDFLNKNGCNARKIASFAGYVDIFMDFLIYWAKRVHLASKEEIPLLKSFKFNKGDISNITCLMKASIIGHCKIVELLLRF